MTSHAKGFDLLYDFLLLFSLICFGYLERLIYAIGTLVRSFGYSSDGGEKIAGVRVRYRHRCVVPEGINLLCVMCRSWPEIYLFLDYTRIFFIALVLA